MVSKNDRSFMESPWVLIDAWRSFLELCRRFLLQYSRIPELSGKLAD
ncbi:MAG: hypothetical protein K8R46_04420 [Pirellulales bacterium]|nr:hypothetical protein [Pirellulales bacterium]